MIEEIKILQKNGSEKRFVAKLISEWHAPKSVSNCSRLSSLKRVFLQRKPINELLKIHKSI